MPLLLDLLYGLLLVAAAPWLAWRSLRTGRYRQGWNEKLFGRVPRRLSTAPCLWLHAVSVGEVNLLAPLLAQWTRRHPDWDCVISTTTQTGHALARQKYPQHTVFYCPLDFSWAVRNAMRRVRPNVLVLAELELWPNLIAAARASGAQSRRGQWSAQRAQLSWLSAHRLALAANAVAHQPRGGTGPGLRRSLCRARMCGRSRGRHWLDQVRRLPDRSSKPRHAISGAAGWHRAR